MYIAKVSANGQITVPVEIRRLLRVGPGDRVLFTVNDDGDVIFAKANVGHADARQYASSERAYQRSAFAVSQREADAIDEIIAELNSRAKRVDDKGRESDDDPGER